MATINETTDYGNFATSAQILNLGDTARGSLSTASDRDFFKVSVAAGGVLKLDFVPPTASTSIYFYLAVYDGANKLLAADFVGNTASLSLGAAAGGSYSIQVAMNTHYSGGQYALTVTAGAGNASGYESESNDSIATANSLILAQPIKGQLASSSDVDYYHVVANAAGVLVVDFTAPTRQASGSSFTLGIYDAAGTLLQTQNTGTTASLATLATPGGDYYVKVTQANLYDGGNYSLTASNDSLASMGAKSLSASAPLTATLAGSHDWYAVNLTAGTPYEFAAKGSSSGGGTLADPSLSLCYADGRVIESCDNLNVWSSSLDQASTSADPQIAFTAPQSGTYYLMVSGKGASGSYTLSQTTDTAANLVQPLVESQANPNYRWNASSPLGTGISLTYAFLSSNADGQSGFVAMTAAQQQIVRDVLAMYSSIANVSFTPASDLSAADIRFGTSDQVGVSSGVTYTTQSFSGRLTQADVFLNNTSSASSTAATATLSPGGYGYMTLIHEIGHALALKHPGNYNSTSSAGADPPYLPPAVDNEKFTVMSYLDNADSSIYHSTPALLDIAALQTLYGPPAPSAHSFSFSASSPFVASLLGYGSADTLDISNQTLPSTVFLTPGSMSSIGAASGGHPAHDNVSIPYSESVANLIDGPAADFIVGNSLDNRFYGFSGADSMDGGGGLNTLVLAATSADLNAAGDDQLRDMQIVDASAATSTAGVNIDLHRQTEAIDVNGSRYADTLVAAAGGGAISGGGGNDRISGNLANTLAVYAGARANYSVTVGSGGLTVQDKSGSEGTDTLTGIERVQMAGTKYAFDWSGSAGTSAKLIAAAFGPGHLHDSLNGQNLVAIGLSIFDQGYGIPDVAGAVLDTTLFHQLVGSSAPTTADVVRLLYANVVGQPPSNADLQAFVGLGLSPAQLLVLAADSDANAQQLTLLGIPATGLDYV